MNLKIKATIVLVTIFFSIIVAGAANATDNNQINNSLNNDDPADLSIYEYTDAIYWSNPGPNEDTYTSNYLSTVTYNVLVDNYMGPDPATNVVVTDIIPDGLIVTDVFASNGNYNIGTDTWDGFDLDAYSGSEYLFVTCTVNSTGILTNHATVTSDIPDPDPTYNTYTINMDIPPASYFSITKEFQNASGQHITRVDIDTIFYAIFKATNMGPDPSGLSMTDVLNGAPYFQFASDQSGENFYVSYDLGANWTPGSASGIIFQDFTQWGNFNNIPTIPVGNQVWIKAGLVIPNIPGTFTGPYSDDVETYPDYAYTDPSTATDTIDLINADLSVFKWDDADYIGMPANYKDWVHYYIQIDNLGPDDAQGVVLSDYLPAQLAIDPNSILASQGTFDPVTGVWTVTDALSPFLYSGNSAYLSFLAQVVGTGFIDNSVVVSASTFDPDETNNSWVDSIYVNPAADINISKELHGYDWNDPIGLGPVITSANYYDWVWGVITVTNNGPDNASVIIQDTSFNWTYYDPVFWPDQWAFDDGNGYIWYNTNFDATTGIWTFDIPNGATYKLAIIGYISGTGTANNTATQTYQDNYNPNYPMGPPYGSVTDSITVPPASIIRIGNDTTLPKEFRYTLNGSRLSQANYLDWLWSVITTSNDGPDPVNVQFQDTPSGFTPNGTYAVSYDDGISWNYNDGSYDVGTGLWNINLQTGASALLAIYGQITQTGTITNTISEIAQDTYNPYGPFSPFPNDYPSYTARINVPQAADIGVTKEFYYEDLGPISYPDNPMDRYWKFFTSIIVTNDGPDIATNVVITDLLSSGLVLAPFDPYGSWFVTYTGQDPDLDPPENNPSFDPNTMTWTIPLMNPGDVWYLDFFTIADTTGNVSNTATFNPATADQYDWNSSNDVGYVSTYVPTANTVLTKWFQYGNTYGTTPTDTANYLDNLYAFIKLHNIGPDTAKFITIIDDFPGDLTYNSSLMEVSYDGGLTWITDPNAYWLDFGTYFELEWFPNDIPTNSMALFRIPAQVNKTGIITNVATESQRTFNPDGDNVTSPGFNTITTNAVLTVPPAAILEFTKTVSAGSYNYKDTIHYYLTVKNPNGPDNATGVSVFDLLPSGLIFQNATANMGAYDINTHTWTIGTLNIGQTATLDITAIIDNTGIIDNIATLTQTTYPQTPVDKTVSISVPPAVINWDPAPNAVNVPANKVIVVTFLNNIYPGNNFIELLNKAGTNIAFNFNIVTNQLFITPVNPLAEDKYTVILHTGSLVDINGIPIANINSKFTAGTPPVVTNWNPASNAVNVPLNTQITVTFNESIKQGNMFIELLNKAGTVIPITTSIGENILKIKPVNPLKEDKYTVILHTGCVTDLAGNPVANTSSKFTAGTPPTVTKWDPASGATNISRSIQISITFNENIKAGNMFIELKNNSGTTIPFTTSIGNNILKIKPNSKLAANTKFTVYLHTGCVTDTAGNPLAGVTSKFTTGSS